MGAAVCAAGLLVSCTKDGNGDETPVHPMVGTYGFAPYEVTEMTSGETTFANFPVSGPLYAVWEANDAFTDNMQGVFRMMGGCLLPQALGTIELKADGYVGASYVPDAQVKADNLMTWAMGTMFTGTYPTVEEVTADAATEGFVSTGTEDKFVSWSEKNGVLTLKIAMEAVLGGEDAAGIGEMIDQILSMAPADIKVMLAGLLSNEDLNKLNDGTIVQLKRWVIDGIPMNVKEESGKTNIYLPKSAFDSMMTLKDMGTTDSSGNPVMKNDLMILWDALSAAGLIPDEAKIAGAMIQLMGTYWEKTTDFSLGFSLVKNS